ncbi:hypothetical protein SKAU_G00125450 [Synaphobranchus kaupii]|uniref:Uncharacterized protein n=1 Tax=Synaphobranchus kaupii TaxID=118154 RepID=A0A9Q1FPL1_SYNKA|nr:hypothetical protein SKAU_G00125450 [Synaphobranchus kaupii]
MMADGSAVLASLGSLFHHNKPVPTGLLTGRRNHAGLFEVMERGRLLVKEWEYSRPADPDSNPPRPTSTVPAGDGHALQPPGGTVASGGGALLLAPRPRTSRRPAVLSVGDACRRSEIPLQAGHLCGRANGRARAPALNPRVTTLQCSSPTDRNGSSQRSALGEGEGEGLPGRVATAREARAGDGVLNARLDEVNAKESRRHFIKRDPRGTSANELQIRSLL